MHPELQYKQLVIDIMEHGDYRHSAWERLPGQPKPPGTYTLNSQTMRFDLSTGQFPMLTLRQQWFKAIVAELLWYLSGSTNVHDLQALGANVWNQWATPETAGTLGWKNGELGPIYGAQWRNFGGRVYHPDGLIQHIKGYDQIQGVIDLLRSNPDSKRARVVGWHPADMERCFVATCHGDLFFSVLGDRLHMEMVQRSGDVPVGVPFNISCYSLLLLMMAQVLGLEPGVFYHHIWDAHIYEDQLPAMEVMVQRDPLPWPQVLINPKVRDIFAFKPNDFELLGYQHHSKLDVPVAT